MADGAAIISRYKKLRTARSNFDNRWETMAPFLAPSRMGILASRAQGENQTKNVYDSTGIMAAEMFSKFIAGHIINPSQRWVGLELADPAVKYDDDVREWAEECRDRMLDAFQRSMFYSEGPESFIDYAAFGTGFLLCEESPQPVHQTLRGFRGLYFKTEKIGRYVIEEGPDGLVDTAMREFALSARVANSRFPHCTPAIKDAAMKEPDKPFKFVHAIYPRPRDDGYGKQGALGMPWASCWIEMESKEVVYESGYRTFPASVPRMQKTPDEVYGRGRGDIAFPDIWTLNALKKLSLEDFALKAKPPLAMAHDGVIGSIKLGPGLPIMVNAKGRPIRDVMMPWETGSRPEVTSMKEEELRKQIRQIFFVDQIMQLMEVNKSEMTAFEFARKIELLFRLMGPVYGRLEKEYLHRLIDTAFDVMLNAGAFSPPPQSIFRSDGNITAIFQNPIAKAQRSGDAEALAMVLNDVAPLANLKPEMLDWIDIDESMSGDMEIRGFPAKWTKTKQQVAAVRKERMKQDQQANALAAAEQAGKAAGAAAPMVKVMNERTQGAA